MCQKLSYWRKIYIHVGYWQSLAAMWYGILTKHFHLSAPREESTYVPSFCERKIVGGQESKRMESGQGRLSLSTEGKVNDEKSRTQATIINGESGRSQPTFPRALCTLHGT